MVTFIVALSVASVLTSVFSFRFRAWKRPRWVGGYFVFFFLLELLADYFVMPPEAMGLEVAVVCFGITGLFVAAIFATKRLEQDDETR